MKLGVFSILPDVESDPAIVARHAESLGFSSYWVPDHIILPVKYDTKYPGNIGGGPDPDYLWKMPDPLVTLMRAATATSQIEIGTAVMLIPERNPIHLAKEVASLDHFSNGRFNLGIGAGWNKEESQIMGGDFKKRWRQTKEYIEIMKRCWIDNESSYSGDYLSFPPLKCFPKPAQNPYPPIFLPSIMIGGEWSKLVFKRIAEWADGWLPVIKEINQLKSGLDQIEKYYEKFERVNDCRIKILGAEGQWRTKKEIDDFRKLGVEEVIIWLKGQNSDQILKELDMLSEDLF